MEKKVEQYDKSGLSMRQWCRENGEVYSTFRCWKNAIHEKKEKENVESCNWVSFNLPDDKCTNDLITVKHKEYEVEIQEGFNKELLTDVLRVLKTI